jgi:outer membrane beta-barrel protein
MRNYQLLLSILSFSLLALPLAAHAQKSDDDLDVIELELDKQPAPQRATTAPAAKQRVDDNQQQDPLNDFNGLGRLAPFREVSVIQKRFLPKTERFQFYIGPTLITNDPFFNTIGGELKASYFLSESWGVELNYFALTTSEKDSTKDLKSINGVSTVNLVYPKSYIGLDLMYVPIYGKMSWFNRRIVPFDLYFSAGYGTTNTQAGENAGTVHLATGQIFSLTKAMAFRWDFSWNFYNATGIDGSKGSFNNLFLTAGVSFFFPEATYR